MPKGRRNANETTGRAAEREGFEESGYRNRLLPLPMKHRQTDPDEGHQRFVTEPIWTQLLPLTSTSQYMLFWYAAESVPPKVEKEYSDAQAVTGGSAIGRKYDAPPSFPTDTTLAQRIAQDQVADAEGKTTTYEPVWHEGTGVDEEEQMYRSFLLPIAEARQKLRGSVMEDVIRRAWEGVQLRIEMETEAATKAM